MQAVSPHEQQCGFMHETTACGAAGKVVVRLCGFLGALAPHRGAEMLAVGALGEHGVDDGGFHALEGLGGLVREAA